MEKHGLGSIYKYLDHPKEQGRPGRGWVVIRSYQGCEFGLALLAFGSRLPKPDLATKEHRIFFWKESGVEYLALCERAKEKKSALQDAEKRAASTAAKQVRQ